jgi:hypothetical protein
VTASAGPSRLSSRTSNSYTVAAASHRRRCCIDRPAPEPARVRICTKCPPAVSAANEARCC